MLDIGGRSYAGHAGIGEYYDDIDAAWAEWRVDVERVEEAADGRVVIVMTMHARGKGSGIEVEDRTAHVWTCRDSKLSRNELYREPEEALRALGLRGDPGVSWRRAAPGTPARSDGTRRHRPCSAPSRAWRGSRTPRRNCGTSRCTP